MDRTQLATRLLASCALSAVFATLLDLLGLALTHDVSPGALWWIGLGNLCLALLFLCLLVPLVVLVAPLVPAPIRSGAARLASSRAARHVLGGFALALAVVLHAANASLYVRLYASIHQALSALTLLLCFCAFALLEGPWHAASVRARQQPISVLAIAAFALFGLTGVSLARITTDPVLRVHALEESTLLAHELHALDRVTGILAIDDTTNGPRVAAIDPALLAQVAPMPMRAPSGFAKGAHVLMVTIDSMRADRWQAGGAPQALMPNLEALAGESTRFTRAYAPSCWTIHSMSAVLYGRLPSHLHYSYVGATADFKFIRFADGERMARDPLSFKKATPVPDERNGDSLIDVLKRGGYETATVASYIYYFRDAGLTADFEHVDESAYRSAGIGVSGLAHVPMVERAAAFLDARDRSRPFFLWLHFMDPHAPYEARDRQAEGQGPEERYDSELRHVDAQLAGLRAALTQRGLFDDTLMIVHADHGEEFGEHGGSFHASALYDETVHVPLFMRLPKRAPSTPHTVETTVGLLDLAPTLLDALGIASEVPFMGRSLVPALRSEALLDRPQLMECERFAAQKHGYLRWPFKLILDHANKTVQLFALPGDPGERENLAGRESVLRVALQSELLQLEHALRAAR